MYEHVIINRMIAWANNFYRFWLNECAHHNKYIRIIYV